MTRSWRPALLVLAALAAGCGARSSLEAGESPGEGGSSATTTSTSSGTTTSTTSTTTSTSTTTTTSTSTTTTTTTITTTVGPAVGCADGTREGFVDLAQYTEIAACGGGFQVPGLLGELSSTCALLAGNDSANPAGAGCSAADLCAIGWHVCKSAAEVGLLSPTGCDGAAPGEPAFFATRQSGPGCGLCATGTQVLPGCESCNCVQGCLQTEATANDLFGCGNVGDVPSDCGVLNRFSNDVCDLLDTPWSCGSDGCNEAHNVSKSAAPGGGVLCCHDQLD